ncbi:uncharacterized protein LY89DRAFT_707025 [Mollisia scopiformis]|uniref:Uncharacterized protein n=1 Tax=Mollisia scopiformis TaxID=149040 RepID=A0A194XCI2_MOLSC|nr:uncharacterized protein LY89DRAFT_707025 [Mollisia scopiformis]KUJ17457.1 hypothetical protein LY89DRAFT_707025 [Mollisia scopiformis]
MPIRHLLRKPFYFPRPRQILRHQSTSAESRTRARITSLHARLPNFLHPYTCGLLTAPISHLVSFLILHEITAVVPLIGLASLFHYTNWLPEAWVEGRWVKEGVDRFGRYFGRKGWFGFSAQEKGEQGEGGEISVESEENRWRVGERGGRILVEVATAYAITKVFLPARMLLSVWGTPWFARVFVGRFTGLFRGVKGAGNGKGAAGLGASAGGVGGGIGKDLDRVKKMPP